MKRTNKFILSALLSVSALSGCDKYLDINRDPNSPSEVTEKLMTPSIISTFAYEVAGGLPVRTSVLWTKHLATATAAPHEGNYLITANDVNNFWRTSSYTHIMKTANDMIALAKTNNNPRYSAIGKIMLAWNMSYVTDAFGDAPLTEAFKGESGIIKPKYDKQEDIYKAIQVLLDEGITEAGATTGLKPGTEDFIYAGDMAKWQKLARTLKARFYLRLSNAPGYVAATQANLALTALAAGSITGTADMPKVAYAAKPNAENPWYQYAIDGKWSTSDKPSIFYVSMLVNRNDPRLPYQVSKAAAGANAGKYSGVVNDAPPFALNNYSSIAPFYSAADASLNLLMNSEPAFIKAEAEFLKAGKVVNAAVIAAYNEAVTASMTIYGVAAADITTYLAAHVLSAVPATAYAQIMTEKYIANYLQFESYNDWRRTGYPLLPINNEAYTGLPGGTAPVINSIPVRFPYPSSERSYNQENIPAEIPSAHLQAIIIPVWWDK
ncbi:SusD/RagB family nutrient-binding outer membrane lipoprotein [Hufsiella ginkgonis]|uniref:SusD/RagB family nutrient-binding outer membrane lipoprotein n=1 Tax=Hufsiella ginkgonis TaxID=2695274 RepID=A0A7K1XYR7_9SPHI|nr:SusD/RagB family nutrient-binding outer membrane lipoprotein [Hufsiella ginkgonis]MXV16092.1 SusD/RagB family nutrient-binding outer membrane lipoprotein [Hufsiella ginkgonis]